jgi:hypothetical protein
MSCTDGVNGVGDVDRHFIGSNCKLGRKGQIDRRYSRSVVYRKEYSTRHIVHISYRHIIQGEPEAQDARINLDIRAFDPCFWIVSVVTGKKVSGLSSSNSTICIKS